MESFTYRSIIVASQQTSWLLSQLLRARYSIRVHRPTGLFKRDDEGCLILAPTHQTIYDPALLMCALPYRDWRALLPLRVLATQTFTGTLRFFKPIIIIIYWFWGVIQLPPMDDDDDTLPEKLQDLLKVLKQGDVVMIFPEGELWRRREPPIGKFAPGVVYLQKVTGASIVPIAVWMSERWWPRRRCTIRFGQPVRIPEHLDLDAGAEWLRAQTLTLREEAEEGVAV